MPFVYNLFFVFCRFFKFLNKKINLKKIDLFFTLHINENLKKKFFLYII